MDFAQQREITFPLLSDANSSVIRAFELVNEAAPQRIAGVPHPGTIVVDRSGRIRAKLFYEGYRERHGPTDILEAVQNLPQP